jgi:SAM-dependent methyltransferase
MYAAQIQERYHARVELCDIEHERVREASENGIIHALVSTTEHTPYAANTFDTIISNEVIEHVDDDTQTIQEMARILKPGGRVVIFCPNRWYPFETHGHYWRGTYHFGNTPLINYLPDAMRDKLAPHVRAYTKQNLINLLEKLPFKVVHYARIYGGYDNLIPRLGQPMIVIRDLLYKLENTPFDIWGLSHLLVIEKLQDR